MPLITSVPKYSLKVVVSEVLADLLPKFLNLLRVNNKLTPLLPSPSCRSLR